MNNSNETITLDEALVKIRNEVSLNISKMNPLNRNRYQTIDSTLIKEKECPLSLKEL